MTDRVRLDGDSVRLALPDDATAPGIARRSVRATLTRWQLPKLVDACVLAASELVTNARLHGRPPVGLLLRRTVGGVRLEVNDGDPHLSARPVEEGSPDVAESGRGLDIVGAVSDDTWCERIPGDGKTVVASWRTRPRTP